MKRTTRPAETAPPLTAEDAEVIRALLGLTFPRQPIGPKSGKGER